VAKNPTLHQTKFEVEGSPESFWNHFAEDPTRRICLTEFLSFPFTIFYCVRQLLSLEGGDLTVDVIGASQDVEEPAYLVFGTLLELLHLSSLDVGFIGPQVSLYHRNQKGNPSFRFYSGFYHHYRRPKKPDLVICFNSGLVCDLSNVSKDYIRKNI
jgi:hypothetical protein